MFPFFSRPKVGVTPAYTALLFPTLESLRGGNISLQEFQSRLWQSLPSVTIPLEYRGDHRIPFVVHAEPWLAELKGQRLSRPILKVCDVPLDVHAVDLLDGLIESITPLSTQLQQLDMRAFLVPKHEPTTEDLLQFEMRALLVRFLTGGPLSLCHLGLSTMLSFDSMPNILFNRLSTVQGQRSLAPSEPDGVLLGQQFAELPERHGALLRALDRQLEAVASH